MKRLTAVFFPSLFILIFTTSFSNPELQNINPFAECADSPIEIKELFQGKKFEIKIPESKTWTIDEKPENGVFLKCISYKDKAVLYARISAFEMQSAFSNQLSEKSCIDCTNFSKIEINDYKGITYENKFESEKGVLFSKSFKFTNQSEKLYASIYITHSGESPNEPNWCIYKDLVESFRFIESE